ncbi:hypothetical protein CF319_g4471 [Tilletia indica]|nr:hypothetical protein CF319_g4471 [Tilletia indica]
MATKPTYHEAALALAALASDLVKFDDRWNMRLTPLIQAIHTEHSASRASNNPEFNEFDLGFFPAPIAQQHQGATTALGTQNTSPIGTEVSLQPFQQTGPSMLDLLAMDTTSGYSSTTSGNMLEFNAAPSNQPFQTAATPMMGFSTTPTSSFHQQHGPTTPTPQATSPFQTWFSQFVASTTPGTMPTSGNVWPYIPPNPDKTSDKGTVNPTQLLKASNNTFPPAPIQTILSFLHPNPTPEPLTAEKVQLNIIIPHRNASRVPSRGGQDGLPEWVVEVIAEARGRMIYAFQLSRYLTTKGKAQPDTSLTQVVQSFKNAAKNDPFKRCASELILVSVSSTVCLAYVDSVPSLRGAEKAPPTAPHHRGPIIYTPDPERPFCKFDQPQTSWQKLTRNVVFDPVPVPMPTGLD